MTNETSLSPTDVAKVLSGLSGWKLSKDGKEIAHPWTFPDFAQAKKFVDRLAEYAESVNHHPNIHWSYTTVTVNLSTHSAGGVTEKDLAFARAINDTSFLA